MSIRLQKVFDLSMVLISVFDLDLDIVFYREEPNHRKERETINTWNRCNAQAMMMIRQVNVHWNVTLKHARQVNRGSEGRKP